MRFKKTKTEANQDIVNDYIEAGQPWPADKKTIAAWAVLNKKWLPQRRSMIDQCAQELADAMRLEMEKDPQGRTVRAKICAKISEKDKEGKLVQRTMWFGRNAEPKLMRLGIQQQRDAIMGDCKALKTNRDSYNDNNTYGAFIPLSLDFTTDVEDSEHDTEYNPPKPPDDDEDD